jgi:hypothetical protein
MICDGTDMNDNFFALFLAFAIDYLTERERERERDSVFFFFFLSAEVLEKNIEILMFLVCVFL